MLIIIDTAFRPEQAKKRWGEDVYLTPSYRRQLGAQSRALTESQPPRKSLEG